MGASAAAPYEKPVLMQSLKRLWKRSLRAFQAFSTAQNKTPSAFANGVSEFNLDDDLLSHGETPHYHRRCIVSLLSSGWDQVVPMLYGRQEIRVLSRDLLASLQQIGYVTAFGVL